MANRTKHQMSKCLSHRLGLPACTAAKDGILRKTESRYESDPWTITSVHTNGTIRVQRRTKSERLNIRRVTPYFD
eukprot:CCRYP_018949-RA/>CCRYP_018949-RA protein AED:0.48 eAED:0.50 QI:0/0/0/1/0/0/2/0/74